MKLFFKAVVLFVCVSVFGFQTSGSELSNITLSETQHSKSTPLKAKDLKENTTVTFVEEGYNDTQPIVVKKKTWKEKLMPFLEFLAESL